MAPKGLFLITPAFTADPGVELGSEVELKPDPGIGPERASKNSKAMGSALSAAILSASWIKHTSQL
jgi:hypothetical protein